MPSAKDHRLYVPRSEEWRPHVMGSEQREYCHAKFPDEPHYHLLIPGEIYLSNGEQKYCVDCARRQGLLTIDRAYWQKDRAADVPPPPEGETNDMTPR